jgi:branched-chain amino acid aminotransferase
MTPARFSTAIVDGPVSPVTPIAYVNGAWGPASAYGATVTTQALQYGTGAFEGIRAYWDALNARLAVVRLREHITRLADSCKILRLELGLTVGEIEEIVVELLTANGHAGDLYIRPLAFKSRLLPGTPFGVRLAGVSTSFSVYCLPMPSSPAVATVRCGISSWRRTPDESVPARGKITGNYVNIALAVDEAEHAGFDDAILLNTRGFVAEASTANVFLVRDAQIITPSLQSGILGGITRSCVLEIAGHAGLDVASRDVQRSELFTCDEIFLSGTACEITAVTEIDGRPVGPGHAGPVTRQLAGIYGGAVRGREPRYAHWLTGVPVPAAAQRNHQSSPE